ncbi:exosome-associated family protein [Microsporum canis CBS 113480]|uniref:Exosome complex protein n=1 Tax=Arthroderma otae (strain ATCC MYA-4605 / CBS 113480) TaxID=554155 RepID=C5FZH3_ARTOC|nr:exosome-associated family protein [Microsporum canis CBS 113480]EEQ35276.1 exosome-associated family protein [Microsporum canis CBS 113480]
MTTETTDLKPLLEQLEDDIDDIEDALEPLLEHGLATTSQKLPLMEKAKLHVLLTYSIESLIFSYLCLNDVDAKEHPVFKELARAGNDKVDLERAEREAKDKAMAQLRASQLAKMKGNVAAAVPQKRPLDEPESSERDGTELSSPEPKKTKTIEPDEDDEDDEEEGDDDDEVEEGGVGEEDDEENDQPNEKKEEAFIKLDAEAKSTNKKKKKKMTRAEKRAINAAKKEKKTAKKKRKNKREREAQLATANTNANG